MTVTMDQVTGLTAELAGIQTEIQTLRGNSHQSLVRVEVAAQTEVRTLATEVAALRAESHQSLKRVEADLKAFKDVDI